MELQEMKKQKENLKLKFSQQNKMQKTLPQIK
jgi:hypothetical protein